MHFNIEYRLYSKSVQCALCCGCYTSFSETLRLIFSINLCMEPSTGLNAFSSSSAVGEATASSASACGAGGQRESFLFHAHSDGQDEGQNSLQRVQRFHFSESQRDILKNYFYNKNLTSVSKKNMAVICQVAAEINLSAEQVKVKLVT